jgi:catechol 2,3-dioxygenase-like lactoylglutathione lyase family enzyme
MELEGIDHIALSVRDVERAEQWYIDVLGFERRHEGMWNGVPVFIGKGATALALFPARENSNSSGPADIRMLHFAMRANRKNFLVAQEELKRRGIKFELRRSRDLALDLFSRSGRARARDHDPRTEVALRYGRATCVGDNHDSARDGIRTPSRMPCTNFLSAGTIVASAPRNFTLSCSTK